ncbi:MAG TPA: hypothetical protein VMA72_03700 [Streptosporangiaceae bacterium]|nr:hypothetical protein [Streptosporangiaceae bacterium]
MATKSELGMLAPIGRGGFGTVYEVLGGYQVRGEARTPLAYKEFKPGAGSAVVPPADAVRNALEFRANLNRTNPRARDDLDKFFAWPWEIVMSDVTGEACGFLMPLAGRQFRWDGGSQTGKLRGMEWLITTETQWQAAGADLSAVTETDRLFLMCQLAYAIALLHGQDWVFRDLSFKNAAFGLDPPELKLFDCDDASRSYAQAPDHQPHTFAWKPPECTGDLGKSRRLQSNETDVYKLGLAIVRCLRPGSGAASTSDVRRLDGILDAAGIELVSRAVSVHPEERPSARDLFFYLKKLVDPRMVPPHVETAEIITPLVLSGADATVSWHIERADTISLFLGDDLRQPVATVAAADHPDLCAVPVDHSGQITIEAANQYGVTRLVIGDVSLYEIPPFSVSLDELPMPNIPALGAFSATPPDVPRVPDHEFGRFLRQLNVNWAPLQPRPRVDHVAAETAQYLIDLICAESEEALAALRAGLAGAGQIDAGDDHG